MAHIGGSEQPSTLRPMPSDLPKWLVGDWNRVIRDPLDLLRLVPLIGGIVTLIVGDHEYTGALFGTFLLLLAPRILNVPRPFDLMFQLGMNLALWGNVVGLFDDIYGYDKVVHFILPCGSSMLLYIVITRLRIVPDLSHDNALHNRAAMVLFTLMFGLLTGGIFEIWEWFSNTVFGTHMYVSYGDSIGDLIDDGLGALIGGVFLLVWADRGWGTWRTPGAVLTGEEPMPAAPDLDSDPLVRFGERLWQLRPPRARADEPPRPYPTLPRWLVGDWGRVVRDPVDLVRLSLLVGILVSVAQGDWEHAARFTFGFGLSALVRAANVARAFDAAFALAMAFQAWGAFSGAFDSVAGYEVAARIVSTLSIAILLYLLLVRIGALPDLAGTAGIHERAGIALVTTSLGFGVGILYEIGAWAANGLFDARPITFEQLIAHMGTDLLASAAAGALLVWWDMAKWQTWRVPASLLVRPAA